MSPELRAPSLSIEYPRVLKLNNSFLPVVPMESQLTHLD